MQRTLVSLTQKVMDMLNSVPLQYLFFLTLIATLISPSITSTKLQRLVTRLIHRDSVSSLFYLNGISTDPADRLLHYSNARFAYLQAKAKGIIASEGVQANLLANIHGHLFVVNFSIGQPPIAQLAVLDTGSSLTWLQCSSCERCMSQEGPIYDPSMSSTYADLSCSDCHNLRQSSYYISCNDLDYCTYSVTYVDESKSEGHIATEQLIFGTSNDNTVVLPDVVFGCGVNNTDTNHGMWGGVFGLGKNAESMVHKLGNKFSYCIGNIDDPLYSFNRLAFGGGANVEGLSTPFKTSRGLYYVTVEGISLGQERLDIDLNALKTSRGGGVILDSGSTMSYMPDVVYYQIRDRFSRMLDLDGSLRRFVQTKRLCYYGKVVRDLQGLPVMTIHLAEGAELVLDAGSLFYHIEPEVFCLSFLPNEPNDDDSVIGARAQLYYNVAFDLDEERIYFQRIDCELLDD